MMQSATYCENCKLYDYGQNYVCSNCNNQITVMLNPDKTEGFIIDINGGYHYFQSLIDYRSKDKIIQKLISMALQKKNTVDYIN